MGIENRRLQLWGVVWFFLTVLPSPGSGAIPKGGITVEIETVTCGLASPLGEPLLDPVATDDQRT